MTQNEIPKFPITELCGVVYVNTILGTSVRVHRERPYHGLIYKLSGQVKYRFEGRYDGIVIDFSPGTLCYLPEGSDYTVEMLEPGECIAVNYASPAGIDCAPFSCRDESRTAESLFRRLFTVYKKRTSDFDYAAMACAYTLFDSVFGRMTKERYAPKDAAIRRAQEILQEELQNPDFSVNCLHERLGMSASGFRRRFGETFGVPPVKYLCMLRMKRAKELLLGTGDTVEKIALGCGFSDPFYFSKCFLKNCGVCPSDYRRSGEGML